MALTTDDLNAVVAQWEEWTTDAGFRLSIEVRSESVSARIVKQPMLGARVVNDNLYCLVEVHRGEVRVFSERVPHDAGMLRASVTVLARSIAQFHADET